MAETGLAICPSARTAWGNRKAYPNFTARSGGATFPDMRDEAPRQTLLQHA